MIAVFGTSPISFLIASEVFPLETISKYLPRVIRVNITPADSKYNCTSEFPISISYVPYNPYKNAADVPIATSESILGLLLIKDLNPTIKYFLPVTITGITNISSIIA